MHRYNTETIPAFELPFSQAVQNENTLYLSGQVGIDPNTRETVEGFKAQMTQALENTVTVLEYAGSSVDNLIKVTAYLTNMDHFSQFNRIYSEFLNEPYPARSAVGVSELAWEEFLIELDAVAEM